MTEKEILERIYKNLNNGGYYGRMFPAKVRYPFFDTVLWISTSNYIYWHHYGESANKNTLEDLEWVINVIFNMTPSEFVKTYHVRQNNMHYLDEIVYPENKDAI